ncbi:10227_t:CDS:1 [Paraglomus brasilianum]|uniref:10227_t:CDS:1 n=1 Tax=Paraglomus brasilianum TaxID=144538 RepID=A0A9N9B2B5_9GLOM|nr:10227_t:CDS:1 [Paraglomus brasilianum]
MNQVNESTYVNTIIMPTIQAALKDTPLRSSISCSKRQSYVSANGWTLKFSAGWLQKFKDCRLPKLHGPATIVDALPLLKSTCKTCPLELIYNKDETGIFYSLELDRREGSM